MCYTCNCGLPYEDHGDPANITEDMIVKAGQTKAAKHAGRVAAKKSMAKLIELEQQAGELDDPAKDYSEK